MFTATVTAKLSNGASASCLVTVEPSKEVDDVESIKIEEVYPVNADSTIMSGGTAIRYYKVSDMSGNPIANKRIHYSIKEGEDLSSVTNDKGYFDVQIKAYSTNTYTLITEKSTGELRTNDLLPASFKINVVNPKYSQGSDYSASISGKVGAGLEVSAFDKIEFELMDASINGELGRALGIGFDNDGDKTDLNLSVKGSAKGGSSESIGLKAMLWGEDAPNIKANAEVKATYGENNGYKFKFEDFFNKSNSNYYFNGAVAGLAILDSCGIDANGHSALVDKLYDELYKKVGDDLDASLKLYGDQTVNLSAGGSIEVDSGKMLENLPVQPTVTLVSNNENEVYKTTCIVIKVL